MRNVPNILLEMTYRTGDLFVFVCGEGDEGDEADGEPFPVGDAVGGPVAACVV